MGHTGEVYILLVVREMRGNRRFWGLDKKIIAARTALPYFLVAAVHLKLFSVPTLVLKVELP
jgi:hypothetical protein